MDNHLDVFPTSKSVAKYLDWFVSFRSELRERLKVCMERKCPVVTSSSEAEPFIASERGAVEASEPLCAFCSRIEILERKPTKFSVLVTPPSTCPKRVNLMEIPETLCPCEDVEHCSLTKKIDWKKRDGVYPKLWSDRIA